MKKQKFMTITCLALLVVALWGIGPPTAQAMPASPTDESKVPHYYGPYPNWALSPLPGFDIASITVDSGGTGYTAPMVTITDDAGMGSGATAEAIVDATGAITAINVLTPGFGYVVPVVTISDAAGTGAAATAVPGTTITGGMKKFVDTLPLLCDPSVTGSCAAAANNLGQYLPLAVPDQTTFTTANGHGPDADYYVIALVQHRERMSSSLPAPGTLQRVYVQLETPANASWSKHVPLANDMPDGTSVPILMPDGSQAYGVDDPHFLGPLIAATKDKPVRIVFYNLLPTGTGGNLFLPVDSTLMGSGMGPMMMGPPADTASVMDEVRNPMCSEEMKGMGTDCFKDNRATLHLHGGITPWISDGTPHQWITPANENTPWPQGVSVSAVPDMNDVPGVPNCSAPNDGCMTFYYTNQQSARLMFYHDHAWGITRLNVYAGEAAGYLISDATEQKLIATGTIPADQIPLIIQDRTFVPGPGQTAALDPTWDYGRWGKEGDFWYHHVYMPAQNPADPGGMSGYGRWMYGPWFWPPATPPYGPIPNPYYNANCSIDDPATWQYQTDPFCEPPLIPGTPNISVGMEQFNDTPIVNGTAYPTTTVEPKSYRLRILNAANDRFFNLHWYVADATGTEVALKAAEVAAAQDDPNVFPTPDTSLSPAGPNWIQIGTEGGFLPAPVVIKPQPITWITDPTRFDVGNVDQHSLLLAPAERADVIVDFSAYAGKTLILYNDAPAAFPARVSSYDYYTGAPNQWPVSAPAVIPGYGPNTRTVMQVKVADAPPAEPFNLTKLQNAFKHQPDGSGVFESGQHPIIVGQADYNSAYGTNFASASWCNVPGLNINICDGFARIADQGGTLFGFNTLLAPKAKLQLPVEPKAIHDEMNSTTFDEFGRMTANLGVEAAPATAGAQNVTLYPYVNPGTEFIDGTNLPKGVSVTPIATQDGSQIWKITHNGVDTHPIHFHLYDVQLLNRVTWDNIIIKPDPNELGWKDTVRVSPLEDTIVALRPVIPTLPFELPNSIRTLNPMMPTGDTSMFHNVNPQGNPTASIVNQLVNFGWEYVYHCHILSHEEMDMMRPVSLALPPKQPTGLAYSITGNGNNRRVVLTWNDNSISETGFLVQKSTDGTTWSNVGTSPSPLDQPNTTGTRTLTDPATYNANATVRYRVVAQNTVGYGGQFPSMTVTSVSAPLVVGSIPTEPTNLTATLQAGPQVSLTFTDTATTETGFVIERATNGGAFVQITTAPARTNTGGVTYVDTTVATGNSYAYRVAAVNAAGQSAYSNTATVDVPALAGTPAILTATAARQGNNERVTVTWTNVTGETGYTIQWNTNNFATVSGSGTVGANVTTFTTGNIARQTWQFRVGAVNGAGTAWSTPVTVAAAP